MMLSSALSPVLDLALDGAEITLQYGHDSGRWSHWQYRAQGLLHRVHPDRYAPPPPLEPYLPSPSR